MADSKDYLEMAFRSITCFTDDGRLKLNELDELVGIALRDGAFDDNEKRVLRSILRKLRQEDLTPTMLAKIAELRAKLEF